MVIEDSWTISQRRKLREYQAELFLEQRGGFYADHWRRMILWTEEAIAEHLAWKAAQDSNVIELEHYR